MSATIRSAFPLLEQRAGESALIYLDSAATTQKPVCVIDAIGDYYKRKNSNVHRGVYGLAGAAEQEIESVRKQVAWWLNADCPEEVIFTPGATAGLNRVARACEREVGVGDEVVVSVMEHHSNLLPWQRLCEQNGARLRVVSMTGEGLLDREMFAKVLNQRTKVVAITYMSNVLGTVNPLEEMITEAHAYGAKVVVDAAQAIAHMRVDVKCLDCDFLVFSSHKVYGPTGLGILYGKREFLESMDPYEVGGGMVRHVTLTKHVNENLPYRLEAGTPHVAGIVGLGSALTFMKGLDQKEWEAHEQRLVRYAREVLSHVPGLRVLGSQEHARGMVSFTLEGKHALDVGLQLDRLGVVVRTGQHCAIPLMNSLGIRQCIRASFGVYTTKNDILGLRDALFQIQ